MLCSHHLENLKNSIFETVFYKWNPLEQRNVPKVSQATVGTMHAEQLAWSSGPASKLLVALTSSTAGFKVTCGNLRSLGSLRGRSAPELESRLLQAAAAEVGSGRKAVSTQGQHWSLWGRPACPSVPGAHPWSISTDVSSLAWAVVQDLPPLRQ